MRRLISQISYKLQYIRSLSAQSEVNECEMRVIGLRRSGNHPIINWIGMQYPGKEVCLLNCAAPNTNPYLTAARQYTGYTIIFNNFAIDRGCEARGHFLKKACILYSYEDVFSDQIRKDERMYERWLGKSRKKYEILILRDPYNLFASRLASKFRIDEGKENKLQGLVDIWKEHARFYLEYSGSDERTFVKINFNKWFIEKAYRQDVAGQLGLIFTDKGKDVVTSVGMGSSFDGRVFDGNAERMEVLERWKKFTDDRDFEMVLKDREVESLSRKIFGDVI